MKTFKNRKSMPVIVWKEGKLYVAKAISLELASQGKNQEEALSNLQEALDLLLEDGNIKPYFKFDPQNPKIEEVYA